MESMRYITKWINVFFPFFFHLFRFIYKFFTMINFLFVCKLLLLRIECDQTFVSRPGGSQNGTFTAPIINNISNHSRQCLYIFLAGPGQRVEIVFTIFNLRGSPPEYVSFYWLFFPLRSKCKNNV